MCTYAVNFGASPESLAVLMCFAMAISAPYGGDVYGNKKWLTQKDVFRYTSLIFVINLLSIFTIGLATGNIIY